MSKARNEAARREQEATERPADGLFPAYGFMHQFWMQDVESRRVPVGFQVEGRPGTAAEWQEYLEQETDELARFLWPRFDRRRRVWVGAAVASMEDLTRADLTLMMSTLVDLLPLAPTVKERPLKATHQALFEIEDESQPGAATLYPTLDVYLPQMGQEPLNAIKASIKKMSVDFGPAPLRYKEYMQRPRPYQTAFALGGSFSYEFGRSAVSPALPSGHCLQGLVRHAAAAVAHRYPLLREPDGMAALAQHAIDYGDRRVFAGVHYPSDNIASWFLALRLCNVLYGHLGHVAKGFMRQAIRQSVIFGMLEKAVQKDPKHVYAGPLLRLKEEADTPVKAPPG
jgi:hypothetical protein